LAGAIRGRTARSIRGSVSRETIAAETDSDGEFPVDITIPGDTGAPTAVYSGLAKVSADGAVRPYDETTDTLGSFNLTLAQYTDGSDTEVPATASVGLTPIITRLATDHAGATIEHAGETVGVSLESGQTTPTAADANSTTFENVSTATDAEIRSVPGGAQLLSVMQSPSASSTQRYNVDLPTGVTLSELEDGGYLMVDETGESVGRIDAPWAKDASGQSLPTAYTLQGNVLTQTTNTAGAVFPVVADPKISFGLRIYVRYSRAEVREFKARNALVAATTLMGVACGKIPIGWLKVGCLASVAMASSSVLGTFKDAANRDRCVELKFNYQAILMEWSSRARGSWCD
jgi:hypothetical protein